MVIGSNQPIRSNPFRRFLKKNDYTIYLLWRNPLTVIGFVIILMAILAGIFAPFLTKYEPLQLSPKERFLPPSAAHLLGTDEFGRDILARVLYATRTDLLIAISSVMIASVCGTILGSIAGFFRGVLDEIIMRIMDIFQAFPAFILAMGLAVSLGASKRTIIIVVAFIMVPVFARLVRSEMISARERCYAEVAVGMGASSFRIIFKQLLPNCITPVLVQVALSMSYAILDAAGLSFIGLGIRPPEPEWGSMVNTGVAYIINGKWWLSLSPGFVMAFTILGFNLMADGIRDVLDPRLRS